MINIFGCLLLVAAAALSYFAVREWKYKNGILYNLLDMAFVIFVVFLGVVLLLA